MSQWPAYNPEPPTDYVGLRDEAISSRFDEIWADADLLHGALEDAGLPFNLYTATLLCDQNRRLSWQFHRLDDEIDKCLRGICNALEDAVLSAATYSVDNPPFDP